MFRVACASDHLRVAELHAASWRSAYRGILSDAYLDGDILAERGRLWEHRLAQPSERQYILLAEENDNLVGFVCVLQALRASFANDAEPAWGAYLDNLHVRPGLTGRGVGAYLLRQAAHWVAQIEPGWPLHLLVLEGNTAARRFYARHGGALVESRVKGLPDGSTPRVVRYQWRDPARLLGEAPLDL